MPLPIIRLEVLSTDECRRLLEMTTIGRIVLSLDALPCAFPVYYRLHDNGIVFRTGPGTKLTRALDDRIVGFEIDSVDLARGSGWSVLVIGSASLVHDRDEIAMLNELGVRSLAGDRLPHFVRISIEKISGRRIPASNP